MIAALNQVGIATAVTTPVLVAVLATIAGILVFGVGGGLVGPMLQRWVLWLAAAVAEAPRVRQHVQGGPSATQQVTQQYTQQAQDLRGSQASSPAATAVNPAVDPTTQQQYPPTV